MTIKKICKKRLVLMSLVFVFFASVEPASPHAASDLTAMPIIQDGISLPMRDGVELAAALYIPSGGPGPWPVITATTPYDRWALHRIGLFFAKNGYVFAALDVRGRGDSSGLFAPFEHDAEDGYDTIEWLAAQPFSTGDVGMWGGSYGGFNQWAAAKMFPPGLKSLIPAAGVYPGIDFPMWKNVSYPYLASWTAYTSGKAARRTLFQDLDHWTSVYYRSLSEGSSFGKLDRFAGYASPVFKKWVKNATLNDYWASLTPTAKDFQKIDLPILTVTGWYDGAQMGALEYYKRHMATTTPQARDRHYLLIGPFDHAGVHGPQEEVGGLTIDKAALLDMRALEIAWFDWTLKDGLKPAFLKDRVAYYAVGDDAWRYAPKLENIQGKEQSFYLDASRADAASIDRAGALSEQPPTSDAGAAYIYDPADLSQALLGTWVAGPWMVHDKDVMALNGNGLIYETEPFKKNLELVGAPRLDAWISIDTPDTDIRVRLYEITANGKSIYLSRDRIRARYRRSLEKEQLVEPGAIERYSFSDFVLNARQLATGSKLRLVIDAPTSVYEQRNYNSGGIIADETIADARTVTVRIHQDENHESVLHVPLNPVR